MPDLPVSDFTAFVAASIDAANDILGLVDVSAASGAKMKKVTPTALLEASLAAQSISLTELGYLNGVTSAIQTQLDDITTDIAGLQPAGDYITELTGDVTATGPGSVAATIANDAVTTVKILDANVTTGKIADANVTYAKIQNVTDERILGRQGGGAGAVEELSLGPGLSFGTNQIRAVSTPVTLTDGANIATNAALGNDFRVTLEGNRTLDAPTNPLDGQICTWTFIQDGVGNRTITLATGAGAFALGTDITAVTLSTAVDTADVMTCKYYGGTVDRWRVMAFTKGYAE